MSNRIHGQCHERKIKRRKTGKGGRQQHGCPVSRAVPEKGRDAQPWMGVDIVIAWERPAKTLRGVEIASHSLPAGPLPPVPRAYCVHTLSCNTGPKGGRLEGQEKKRLAIELRDDLREKGSDLSDVAPDDRLAGVLACVLLHLHPVSSRFRPSQPVARTSAATGCGATGSEVTEGPVRVQKTTRHPRPATTETGDRRRQ